MTLPPLFSAISALPADETIVAWDFAAGAAPLPCGLQHLRVAVPALRQLRPPGARCSVGLSVGGNRPAAALLQNITDTASPVQILAELARRLPRRGLIALQLAASAAGGTPRWREFWIAAARRLGCSVQTLPPDGILLQSPETAPRWYPDIATDADIPAIGDLFHRVFGGTLTEALYRWKYAAGGGIVARMGGQIVAHCGAMPRRVVMRGSIGEAVQLVDVMVHPSYRGILGRRGVFHETTAAAIETFGPLAFGFPNLRHMQLGQRHGFYAPADRVVELSWSARSNFAFSSSRLLDIELAEDRAIAQEAWARMAADLRGQVLGVRDPEWLSYRYALHPNHCHEIHVVRSRLSGRCKGLVVTRQEGDSLLVLDWVAALIHLPSVARAAQNMAASRGLLRCTTWAAESFAARFAPSQPIIIDPNITVPTIVWCRDAREAQLRGWWLSPGDTDFR